MQQKTNNITTNYLNNLVRINKISDAENIKGMVLLLPNNVKLLYTEDNEVITQGLSPALDSKKNDLISIIEISDPLNIKYKNTNILSPKVYIKSLKPLLPTVCVQSIIISRVDEESKDEFIDLINKTVYGKTSYDTIWVENNKSYKELIAGEIIMIMNRRVAGWDGSQERPVIELLGAGGAMPTVWDNDLFVFKQMDKIDVIIKEFQEELSYKVSRNDITVVGGFHNIVSNELVILCCVSIPFNRINNLQKGALGNITESVDGIYLGRFKETLQLYQKHPSNFAGGEVSIKSNFPSQKQIMAKLYNLLNINN